MHSRSDIWPGALGSWGAALLEPYSDDPKTKGLLLTALEQLVRQFWKDDRQTLCVIKVLHIGVHCIGDKANHDMLDISSKKTQMYLNGGRVLNMLRFLLQLIWNAGKLGGQWTDLLFTRVKT